MKQWVILIAIVAAVRSVPLVSKHFFHETGVAEYVFRYNLNVMSGVKNVDIDSWYNLTSEVHIRPDPTGNGTYIYLTDVRTIAFTGPTNKTVEQVFHIPVLKVWSVITLPFYVTYDSNGMVHNIFTTSGDEEWSVNIKKGIATVLQLPVNYISGRKYDKPFVFTVDEETVHGNMNVSYKVQTDTSGISVLKTPDHITYKHMPYDVFSNIETGNSFGGQSVWNVSYSWGKYWLLYDKDEIKMQEVHTSSVYSIQQSMSAEQVHFITTTQHFNLIDTKTIESIDVMDFSKIAIINPVAYVASKVISTSSFPCLSVVPHVVDMTLVGPKVQAMLYEAVEYLNENPITNVEPDTTRGLVVSGIIEILKPFAVEDYLKLFTLLTKTTTPRDVAAVDVFFKVLPLVGTKHSVVFIRDLVKSHKVKDMVSTMMLFSLGLNVRVPTKELLQEVEEFYHFEDEVKPDVSHAAVLTFGYLVYKTFEHDTHSPVLQQYVKVYYNKLKEAKTYEEQLLWLHGLKNIEVGTVFELIKPIVNGEQVLNLPYDRHLRLHAIYSLEKILHHDYDLLYETVYPVFVDEYLPSEIRIAALKVLLCTQDVRYFTRLVTVLQADKDIQLHAFFVTTLQHMAKSSINYSAEFWQYLKQTLELFEQPDQSVETQAFYYDYFDEKHSFGASVYGNLVAGVKTNKVNQFYISFNPVVMDHTVELYSVFVKFEGIDNPLTMLWPKLFNVEPRTVKEPIIKQYGKEPVHVELTLIANGKVVYVKYFNEETIEQFYKYTYLTLLTTMKYQFTSILNVADLEVFSSTLNGIPTMVDVKLPLVSQLKYDVVGPTNKSPQEVAFSIHSSFRLWMHGFYGVSVYNPFDVMWHGTRRVHSFDINIPINFDVAFNFQQNSLKIVWTKSTNEAQNTVGFKTHVKTLIYAKPYLEVDFLAGTSPYAYTTFLSPVHKKKDVVLYESHSKYTGLHFYLSTYDIAVLPHKKPVKSLSGLLLSDVFHEISSVPFFKFVLSYYTWFYTHFFPVQYSAYGVVGYINPCKLYPMDKVELTFKTNTEEISYALWTTPNYQHYVKMSAIFRNNIGTVINHWDVNVQFTHELGLFFKKFDIQITRKTPEERNMNICLDWVKNLKSDTVDGTLTYFHGNSDDHKCVKDNMVISVSWTGSYSDIQKNMTGRTGNSYKECSLVNTKLPLTYECTKAYTSVRKYMYNVDYQHVLSVYEQLLSPVWFWIQQVFPVYYDVEPHHHIPNGKYIVDVEYPLQWEEHPIVDIVVTSPSESYVFEHVPYYDWIWWLQPDSTVFTRYFDLMKSVGCVTECIVTPAVSVTNNHYVFGKTPVYNEWTMYAANHPTSYKWAVFVKKMENNHFALKVLLNGYAIVVQAVWDKSATFGKPTDYIFTVDNHIMDVMMSDVGHEMYSLQYFLLNHTVVFVVPNVSLYVVYNGVEVIVETVKSDTVTHYGECNV
ncbi:uncharacterized protein LOC131695607 [Topomyia yanbarensis]|uniref:uncharacterized protein LOC131695607 n=1 Tax=Topomyia yanbarensis TaxID=2498891 RepID=UPI00273B24D7|nr:uncharacterized protein LOC131695607 [Topomyia yanbarensis]